jgi:hypothetical protein
MAAWYASQLENDEGSAAVSVLFNVHLVGMSVLWSVPRRLAVGADFHTEYMPLRMAIVLRFECNIGIVGDLRSSSLFGKGKRRPRLVRDAVGSSGARSTINDDS